MNTKLSAIYLKPPQGYLVSKGKKTLVVSPVKDVSYIEKDIYAVSGNKIHAIIQLSKPYPLNYTLFKSAFDRHQITEKEREDTWPNVKQFWGYVIKIKKVFNPALYCGKTGTHNLFIKEVEPKKINEVRIYNGSSYNVFNLADDEILIKMKSSEVEQELCIEGDPSFKLFTPAREKKTVEKGDWSMRDGKAVFIKKRTLDNGRK